jgi:FkbM family methyltransferase
MTPTRETAALPWPLRLALPYLRREGRGWGKLYRWLGGEDAARWRSCGRAVVRGKLHGYEMELDLANWSERLTFCLGRYHDLPLQLALRAVLRPGDAFVDVGANLGLVTLLGSRLVGETGVVLACEPNPTLGSRLQAHVQRNELRNVRIVAQALGGEPGTAELREYDGHSGWGSLSAAGPAGATATATFRVAVTTGDSVLQAVPPQHPLVLKIDVEGHEVPVLRGLQRTLAERQPLVFLEVCDAHQRRAGFSANELRNAIERFGYRGYAVDTRRSLLRHALRLLPIEQSDRHEVDALFAPLSGPLHDRVQALLARA